MTTRSFITRRSALAAFILLVALATSHGAASAAPAAESADPLIGIVRIDVLPHGAILESARATAQLVVTGYDAAGQTRDLTHLAAFRAADEKLIEIKAGRVVARPGSSGKGETSIEVTVGTHRAVVPVYTANLDRPDPIRFRTEVLPALTKQGCNAGSCHGAPEGKGGFALSMLAYKPSIDELSLTVGGLARRVEPNAPRESLLLKKPLLRVTHVGGKKLKPSDAAYRVLHDWVAEGASTKLDAAALARRERAFQSLDLVGSLPDPRSKPFNADDTERCVRIKVMPGPSRIVVAPYLKQQLCVVAEFVDGSVRDVTRLATFDSSNKEVALPDAEGLVTGRKRGLTAITVRYLDFVESVYFTVIEPQEGFAKAWDGAIAGEPAAPHFIDRHILAKLKQLQYTPAGLCDDATFVRRIHLDLTGLLPTAEQVRKFLASSDLNKRAALVDELLDTEEFARHWAQKEADLYRVSPQVLDTELMKTDSRKVLTGRAALFNDWLVDEWRKNTPYDRHVRALLTAMGDTHSVGPSNFFEAIPKQDDVSEATAQLFMGSRINCAKCHNHPFESWTQDDYYRIVAVFTRVRQDNDAITVAKSGEASNPSTGKVMVPWGMDPTNPTKPKPDADRREVFTEWLTQPDNPFFARVGANRIWAHLMGRGIVHPVDDFRSSNPPTNPELLDTLAQSFRDTNFDRRALIRTIVLSRAYQRSTATTSWNEADETLFSHFTPRRLTGEQLRDAIGYASRTLEPVETLGAQIAKRETELGARLDLIRTEQPGWEKKLYERLQMVPVWNGAWTTYGVESAKEAEKVDVAKLPASAWRNEPAWIDLRDFPLDLKKDGVRWFATELHAREAGTATFSLTTDAEFALVLDGKSIVAADAKQRGRTKDVALKLTPGAHRLVVRVEKPADNNKRIRGGLVKWNDKGLERFEVRRDAVDALAVADVLPPDLRNAAIAFRQADDEKVRHIERAIQDLKFRMDYHTQRPFPEQSQFAEAFGQPKRESACTCERSSDPTLDQALNLLNGDATQRASSGGARKYSELSDTALSEEVYLATLARRPTDGERAKVAAFVKEAPDRVEACRDLLWALFNTQEFLFQH